MNKTRLEFRISSASTRWSEIWGIDLYPHELFYLTNHQLKLAPAGSAASEICVFFFRHDRLHFKTLDPGGEVRINGEWKSKSSCQVGDQIWIEDEILIEVSKFSEIGKRSTRPPFASRERTEIGAHRAPLEEGTITFDDRVGDAFRIIETAFAFGAPPEATVPKATSIAHSPIFIDRRPVEIDFPLTIEARRPAASALQRENTVAPSRRKESPRPFLQLESVELEDHPGPDDFCRVVYRSTAIVRRRVHPSILKAKRRHARRRFAALVILALMTIGLTRGVRDENFVKTSFRERRPARAASPPSLSRSDRSSPRGLSPVKQVRHSLRR